MIDPRNMHAYVMGEHGDSEFVPWSQAMMATKPIFDLCGETEGCHFQELLELEEEVRMAAYKIIEANKFIISFNQAVYRIICPFRLKF